MKVRDLFRELRAASESGDRKRAATLLAKLAALAMARSSWNRASKFLAEAQKFLPESSKLLLAASICEWERKNEREAKKKMHALAKTVLRRHRLREYSHLIDTELAKYPTLRQAYYEAIASVERNTALPFIGLARVSLGRGDRTKALNYLVDGLKTGDQQGQVLKEITTILANDGQQELLVQVDRFRTNQLALEDLCLLLGANGRAIADPRTETPRELELGEMIEKLEEELGGNEPAAGGWDKVGPLLNEFRRRAHPVIGNDSRSRLDLALAFYEMRLFQASREELREIGPGDALHPEALCLLGQIFLSEGSVLQAMETYQEILREERNLNQTVRNEAEYQLIRIYVKLEDFGKAMIHIRGLEKRTQDYRDIRRIKETVAERLGVDKIPDAGGKRLQKAG